MYMTALIAGILTTILFLAVRVKKGGVPGTLAKAVPSFFFIATAVAATAANPDAQTFGLLVVLGLVCGLLGDVWLDLKYAYPQDEGTYLYAGFYSFLVGHLFFITAIILYHEWTIKALIIALAMAAAGSAVNLLLEKPMKMDFGKYRSTCVLYGFVLMTTTFLAVVAAYATGQRVWYVFAAGGILFLLSDLVLSGTYFGEGKGTAPYVIVNHGLYYAAQFAIASAILFA